jgi:hypothetical protein
MAHKFNKVAHNVGVTIVTEVDSMYVLQKEEATEIVLVITR